MLKNGLWWLGSFALVFLIGSYLLQILSKEGSPISSYHRFDAPKALTQFNLVDQHLNEINPGDFKGRWSLVFFGFTHCPDICPTTMSALNSAVENLPSPPKVVMVTADPERDSPQVLKQYLFAFNESFEGLSGTSDNLNLLAGQLGFAFRRIPGAVLGTYSVEHTNSIAVINPRAEYAGFFEITNESRDILRIIQTFH